MHRTSAKRRSDLRLAGAVHVLHPGDVVCAAAGERLETLLGSCVAVVLTDRHRTTGAMCHIVHSQPARRGGGGGRDDHRAASADCAIDAMYRLLRRRGLTPRLCQAFVYGGGNMFPDIFSDTHVGENNSRRVLERLQSDGIAVMHHDVGGNAYRRLGWTIGPQSPNVDVVGI